jgi:AcrR family transcriptional regulator
MKPAVRHPDIIEAGARIVAREGADALTMDRLARETGLSRATLYRMSGGREALLDALARQGADVGDRTETRARILAGAREVFGRAGFDAATIEDIAAAANVGTATVYRHFHDKDGLVAAFIDDIAPRRAALAARPTNDVRADLERFAEHLLRGARDDGPLVRTILLEALRGDSSVARVRKASPVRTLSAIGAMLRVHMAAGRLRAGDPTMLAEAFGGMVFAFAILAPNLRGEPVRDPRETARAVTNLFLDGATARPTPRSATPRTRRTHAGRSR